MRQLATGESSNTCLVCDAPLSSIQRHQGVVLCGPRCRGAYSRFLPGQVCRTCGRPLKPEGLAGGLCVGKDCRLKLAEKQAREKEERERKARETVARLIHERATAPGISDLYPLAIIPSNPLEIVSVDQERKRALARHLEGVLSELTLVDATTEPPPPLYRSIARSRALLTVLGGACSLCGGDCCRRGGDRAYLDVATLLRYQRDHPGTGPRDVLDAYLGKVGETVYAGSCIYHQTRGCALPRDMRSDTCNRYFCEELKAFEREISNADTPRVFFAAGSGEVIRAAGFVDENGVRPVSVLVEGP